MSPVKLRICQLALALRYAREHGARAFFGKVARRSQQRIAHTQHRLRQRLRLRGRRPERIHAALDVPRSEQEFDAGVVDVAGWACGPAGIDRVEIYLDGELCRTVIPGLPRSDVARVHPKLGDAPYSGFQSTINAPGQRAGRHTLVVRVVDREGSSRIMRRSVHLASATGLYHRYLMGRLPNGPERRRQRAAADDLEIRPTFYLWLDIRNGSVVESCVEAISRQTYPYWHCYVLVDGPDSSGVLATIREVVPRRLQTQFSVLRADDIPWACETAEADLHAWITPDVRLLPHALYVTASTLAEHPDVELVYSDSDRLSPSGRHHSPFFKPGWSPHLALELDYVGDVYFAKACLIRRVPLATLLARGRPAYRYAMLLALSARAEAIHRIEEVLWSLLDDAGEIESQADQIEVVREHLKSHHINATVEPSSSRAGLRRVLYAIPQPAPKVSLIVPTTGNLRYLKPCIDSIQQLTAYSDYELVVIDNGRGGHRDGIELARSRGATVLERPEPFNWAKLNNDAARACTGDLLVFINDDIEVTAPRWLHVLVGYAYQRQVGAVGSMLLYPDGRIQHAGIFLVDHGGGARHMFHGVTPGDDLYQNLDLVTREVSANTGACLAVRRSVFEAAGGFDEDLALVGNDVDLCLRLLDQGYRNLWTPHATLIHHESVTRRDASLSKDELRMWEKWSHRFRQGDGYYNRHLTLKAEDCSFDIDRALADHREAAASDTSGVNLIGYIRAEMGVGQGARSMAQCLDEAGIPFGVIDYERGNPARKSDETWLHKLIERPTYDVNLLHVNADHVPLAIRHLGHDMFRARYTIGYWAWELPEFPDQWRDRFAYVDEVWVPSRFVQDAVAQKSPVPVIRIPHAVHVDLVRPLSRSYFGLPESGFLFLTMFDLHSIAERKNPLGAIRAFRSAFPDPASNAFLAVKVTNPDGAPLDELAREIGDASNIIVLDKVFSRYELDALLSSADAFVSLHRSEGFGLAIAEAMSLGKPVIATNWSGNTDYMDSSTAIPIGYRLVPLGRDYGPYAASQHWAEPDLEEASHWMRYLVKDHAYYRTIATNARDRIATGYSPSAVGGLVRERLHAIDASAGRGPRRLARSA